MARYKFGDLLRHKGRGTKLVVITPDREEVEDGFVAVIVEGESVGNIPKSVWYGYYGGRDGAYEKLTP